MGIQHLKKIESQRTREEVSTIIKEAQEMDYDSVIIIGIKSGEVFSAHSCKSTLQLLGAIDLVSHDFKNLNF